MQQKVVGKLYTSEEHKAQVSYIYTHIIDAARDRRYPCLLSLAQDYRKASIRLTDTM